jgi:hypothetical protein
MEFWCLIQNLLITLTLTCSLNKTEAEAVIGLNNNLKISGYLNKNGEVEISLKGSIINIEALGFEYGRASVSKAKPTTFAHLLAAGDWGKQAYGLINKAGDIVVPMKYDFIIEGSSCIATVAINGRHGAIDLDGNILIPLSYSRIGQFSEGLAFAQRKEGEQYGYINMRGELVIEPFQEVDSSDAPLFTREFHSGRALFKNAQGKYGYIDEQGNVAIEPIFLDADSFKGGLARFENVEGWGYVNVSGEVVWFSTDEEVFLEK